MSGYYAVISRYLSSSIYLASLDGAELVPMIPRNRISEAIRINLIFPNRKLLQQCNAASMKLCWFHRTGFPFSWPPKQVPTTAQRSKALNRPVQNSLYKIFFYYAKGPSI